MHTYGVDPGMPPHALVADDDRETRQLIAAVLRSDGFEVSEARDGTELVEIVEAACREDGTAPDLIVSDVRMSGDGGLAALRTVRHRLPSTTAILVITAFGDAHTDAEAKEAGAVGVLHKPFDIDDLRTIALNATGRAPRGPRTQG